MYSTCLFCSQSLGRNEMVEAFPVGRRLAFDAAKGRLWVVCPRCERWNLTPLEERWEAIEQCERLFRDTRLRVSTDHIGLAKLKEGLVLVRIGEPQRPEMAAWRYGDQFGRRHRRHLMVAGGVGIAAAGLAVGGPLMGLGVGAVASALDMLSLPQLARGLRQVRIPLDAGPPLVIPRTHLARVFLTAGPDGDWRLRILAAPPGLMDRWRTGSQSSAQELGAGAARRAAGVVLPAMNASGGNRAVVQNAVAVLETAPTADALFASMINGSMGRHALAPLSTRDMCPLNALPLGMRLALEMAAHEEQERRAVEGELAELERAWQQAEEIAGIADDLLLPASVDPALARLRDRASDTAP